MNSSLLLIEILILTYPFRDLSLLRKKNLNYKKDEIVKFIKRDVDIYDLDEFNILIGEYLEGNELLSILNSLSLSLIEHYDKKLFLRELLFESQEFSNETDIFSDYGENHKMLIWYYICRFISTDIILINYLIIKGLLFEDFLFENMSYLRIGDKSVISFMKKGLAENHVHLNGAIHFENQFWYLIGKKNTKESKFDFLKKIDKLNELKVITVDLEIYILICILVRYYLIKFLSKNRNEKLCEYLFGKKINIIFIDFLSGDLQKLSFENRSIKISKIKNKIEEIEEVNTEGDDYISTFINNDNIVGVKNEYWFLYKCLNFLHSFQGQADKMFKELFWGYIRVKNTLFNMKVQSNKTKGLSYFSHFFSGQNGIIPLKDRYDIFFSHYKQLDFVRFAEIRKSIPIGNTVLDSKIYKSLKLDVIKFIESYYDWIKKFSESHKIKYGDMNISFGLVYHFKRIKISFENMCLKEYFLTNDLNLLTFGKYQKQMELAVLAIKKLQNEIPNLKKYIVGIDVAGNEHNMDPALFAPIYSSLRNASSKNDKYSNLDTNIGLTYHVGEVFYSIVTAFRHIDEVITEFRYRSFDRLGHATALMIELKSYLAQRKVSKLPIIEYLENLIYIYILESEEGLILKLEPLELIKKIKKCTKMIFDDDNISIENLVLWYKSKFCSIEKIVGNLKKCPLECPLHVQSKLERTWTIDKLNATRHCKYYLGKMQKIISIKENLNDLEFYLQIQTYLRKKIVRKAIIIESNPISNARIGVIEDESKFLISEIYAKGLDENHEKRLLVSLNTDDPAIFNTNLVYQYVILEKQLIESGYSKTDIDEWLDNMRNIGINSTFLTMKTVDIDELKSIKDILESNL